eukprot:3939199-Rhodomonas_salina.1
MREPCAGKRRPARALLAMQGSGPTQVDCSPSSLPPFPLLSSCLTLTFFLPGILSRCLGRGEGVQTGGTLKSSNLHSLPRVPPIKMPASCFPCTLHCQRREHRKERDVRMDGRGHASTGVTGEGEREHRRGARGER